MKSALTTVSDNPDGGVTLSETCDGGEAHLVGFRLYELSQVVRHEFSFVDCSVYRDLLLPPALQAHLDRRKNHKGFGLLKKSLDPQERCVCNYIQKHKNLHKAIILSITTSYLTHGFQKVEVIYQEVIC